MGIQPFSGKARTADIEAFEARSGISLPDDYEEFLLEFNGGYPSPNRFFIPECNDYALVDVLYGLRGEGEPCDLESEFAESRDVLPVGFIPIGDDPGGNRLLLGTAGESRGRVYYWDSGCFFEPSSPAHNTYLVAESLRGFLESLSLSE